MPTFYDDRGWSCGRESTFAGCRQSVFLFVMGAVSAIVSITGGLLIQVSFDDSWMGLISLPFSGYVFFVGAEYLRLMRDGVIGKTGRGLTRSALAFSAISVGVSLMNIAIILYFGDFGIRQEIERHG